MKDNNPLIKKIVSAFAETKYPGDWCLRGSKEGSEPLYVEEEFKGKTDRYGIDPKFLDKAPKGLSSALSFFSDEAFRFYLPAYLIADIREQLRECNPVFHLTHGLDDKSRSKRINPRRYGDRTWFEVASHKFSMFTREEVSAIVAYLILKKDLDSFEHESIDQALRNYWNNRAV